ncbi:HAD family acid phosphatase [Mycolicibacterium sp. 120270]|uniref:HAD family acid phosphatase n=1 Tax=Mycolicibacterium sp. 120270 TaxID=3090600 RepID=UPI00299F105B|nr:HAD family acid phosphatase [Mycolicibacterium sp. 120270]MDX1887386.1 HAD family acid phosphatase [Mycolicibacterium sp. 120270]
MIARLVAALAAAVLASAPVAVASPPAPPTPIVPPPVQPANIGALKTEARGYYHSGAYLTDLQQAAWPAIPWIDVRAPMVDRPAVVFDIDETALSNWPALEANDLGRIFTGPCDLPQGPCGLVDWDLSAEATVIPPTMDVFNTAKDRGAAIYFITGRNESQRAATERNLTNVGYTGYTRLIMEPDDAHYVSAADFKAPQRHAIEAEGYTIIANLGDQPSDLEGGFAERTFLLPNPFYRIP